MNKLIKKIAPYAMYIAFLQVWAATLGSLYFSEIKQLAPCELCWYQRILIYPLTIILGVAILRKEKQIAYYVLPITLLGAVVAAYHYLLQMTTLVDAVPVSCGPNGPCSEIQGIFLGFITIPLLSLATFVVISLLMYIIIKSNKK